MEIRKSMRDVIVEKIKKTAEPLIFFTSGGFSGIIVKTDKELIVKLPEDEFFNTENRYSLDEAEELADDYSIIAICELFHECGEEKFEINDSELEKIKNDIETHFEEEELYELLKKQNTFENVKIAISNDEFWKKIRVMTTLKNRKDKKIIFEVVYEPVCGTEYADWKIENENGIEYPSGPIQIVEEIFGSKEKEIELEILKIIENIPY